jgi:GDP-L-fucose synthase
MTESNPPTGSAVYVAGHTGMVGSALVRALRRVGVAHIVTRTHAGLDLTDQAAVHAFFARERLDSVFLAAAKVGGIQANRTYPAEFIHTNLAIQCNVIHAALRAGVRRLLFLGSSCIYPRDCPQPMREEHLLGGPLEPTNAPYAVAKIAGIAQCEAYNRQHGTDYRAVMPTNLYGPNDRFDLENSHVLPAMIRKYHLARLARAGDFQGIHRDLARFGPVPEPIQRELAKGPSASVLLWGSGSPRRELLHVDDMAAACLFVMGLTRGDYERACARPSGPSVSHLNVGCGRDDSIRELAEVVREVVGFDGETAWDANLPDGMPVKRLEVSRLARAGWRAEIGLREGIAATYRWYLQETGSGCPPPRGQGIEGKTEKPGDPSGARMP